MIEKRVEIQTADGPMTTFVFHPEEGGPFPVVLYLMDAPSIRPALMDMASRLASAGYYVMLPYLYHRGGPYREFGATDEDMHARKELMATVNAAGVVRDSDALLAHAAGDAAARGGRIGAVGFCMSGPMALAVAQAYGDRVGFAASLHGAWFVKDTPDSAHRNLDNISAELYFGWCDNDPTAPKEEMAILEDAMKAAGIGYRIDFFTDAVHGYAPPGSERYNRAASEKHWERVHALLRRTVD